MTDEKWTYNGVEFKEGDRVQVIGMAERDQPNGMGPGCDWDNAWAEDMTDAIFHEFTIAEIAQEGAFFEEDGGREYGYGYPLSVLKKI